MMSSIVVFQVAKLIKAAEATETDRTLIFEAVGFTFINRLLRTGNLSLRIA